MKRSTILFFILFCNVFYVMNFVYNIVLNRLFHVGAGSVSSMISLFVLFLVVVPLALVTAKKLTEFFIPNSEV
ncbi:hypothetical protein [Alteribacter keqinensis]|uniref:Uncharacterized protein n=1 Tax=Alteribacter keqinensis TaxID=2483800 RepID=A0A3M7TWY4_9BACI|nr:hypothetical protein [Alteribacter keqinensis]RNA70127.1 hypothetical protein EBO34_09420 [Alteribacter keqinensis]